MIYFDLDGVLRDIHRIVNWTPKYWDEPIGGMSIVEFFAQSPELLKQAPPTEYLFPILEAFPNEIRIMSAMPQSWEEASFCWIRKYVRSKVVHINITKHLEKLHLLKPNDILVEDCPMYHDYSQIILIDKSYNEIMDLPHVRVTSPEALIEEIKRRQHGKV